MPGSQLPQDQVQAPREVSGAAPVRGTHALPAHDVRGCPTTRLAAAMKSHSVCFCRGSRVLDGGCATVGLSSRTRAWPKVPSACRRRSLCRTLPLNVLGVSISENATLFLRRLLLSVGRKPFFFYRHRRAGDVLFSYLYAAGSGGFVCLLHPLLCAKFVGYFVFRWWVYSGARR